MDSENYDTTTGEIMSAQRNLPAIENRGERNLIFASPECAEVFGALAEAQGTMANPKKTKTAKVQGQTKSGGSYSYDYKYAPLEEVIDVIRKPLSAAGLVHRQFLAQRDGAWIMRTIIAHRSGQWFGCDYPIFTGRQEGAQGFASGVTYARRYGLMLALGIVGEDDDDANIADGRPAEIAGRSRAPREEADLNPMLDNQEREALARRATAQGSPEGGRAPPRRQQAAPAPSTAKAKAVEDYNQLGKDADEAVTIPELDTIDQSLLWTTMERQIREVEGKDVADELMAKLRRRIERRRGLLLSDAGSPASYGEMG